MTPVPVPVAGADHSCLSEFATHQHLLSSDRLEKGICTVAPAYADTGRN